MRGRAAVTTVGAPHTTTEWFTTLVRNTSDRIFVIDAHAKVLYANPATCTMVGCTEEEIVGTDLYDYVAPEDRATVQASYQALFSSPGREVSGRSRFVTPDGRLRIIEAVAVNHLDNPAIRGIVVNGRDVTDQERYIAELEASVDGIVASLARAIELRDPYTAGHQHQVAVIAAAIATELFVPADQIKGLVVASTLHDVGKIAVPSEILNRPGQLSEAEMVIVRTHAQFGHDIVADVPFPWPVGEMVLQHHERMDGSGYPRGLAGDGILFTTRILMVADVISAMTEHRPYRPALGIEPALAEIERGAGTLYDPVVAEATLRLFRVKHYAFS
jgi:PAS domain S-box-containing protein